MAGQIRLHHQHAVVVNNPFFPIGANLQLELTAATIGAKILYEATVFLSLHNRVEIDCTTAAAITSATKR